MRQILASLARDLDIAVFDGADGMCDTRRCDTMIDGRVVYSDRTHLTREYTASLEPALTAFASGLLGDRA